jgi:thiamine-phosphate pyrophosphorylase
MDTSSPRLYALCDQATLYRKGRSLESFVSLCKRHDAEIIQYRSKGSIASVKRALITLRRLWDRFLIVNDHYELADYCDGVHLGQEDLAAIDPDPQRALTQLKLRIGSDKIVGLSTHTAEEIRVANTLELNYIGLGAYRATGTKKVAHILGDRLDALAAASEHPVAAIGGVRADDRFEYVTYHVIGSGLDV